MSNYQRIKPFLTRYCNPFTQSIEKNCRNCMMINTRLSWKAIPILSNQISVEVVDSDFGSSCLDLMPVEKILNMCFGAVYYLAYKALFPKVMGVIPAGELSAFWDPE